MDNNCFCQELCALHLYAVAHVSKFSSQTLLHFQCGSGGRCGVDRMVVGLTTISAISVYHN